MTDSSRLPLLTARSAALETCGYCPKLCRAACPVSDAEASETLTPWGKMSLAWFAERGMAEATPELAATAWACTGCLACRERCDHANPVAATLLDARAEFATLGLEPPRARAVKDRHAQRVEESDGVVAELRREAGVSPDAPTALVIGCEYLRRAPDVARDAVRVAVALLGPVRIATGCCGEPLAQAGDPTGARAAARRLKAGVEGAGRRVVVDPGCASALGEGVELLLDVAARAGDRLGLDPQLAGRRVVWHDPCRLGRGLGRYDEPRAVLARALGAPPQELSRSREHGVCSGGGGLLPVVMPATSRAIAAARLADHAALGGGTLVTACASSLRRFRASGVDVVDLTTVMKRSLGLE